MWKWFKKCILGKKMTVIVFIVEIKLWCNKNFPGWHKSSTLHGAGRLRNQAYLHGQKRVRGCQSCFRHGLFDY